MGGMKVYGATASAIDSRIARLPRYGLWQQFTGHPIIHLSHSYRLSPELSAILGDPSPDDELLRLLDEYGVSMPQRTTISTIFVK